MLNAPDRRALIQLAREICNLYEQGVNLDWRVQPSTFETRPILTVQVGRLLVYADLWSESMVFQHISSGPIARRELVTREECPEIKQLCQRLSHGLKKSVDLCAIDGAMRELQARTKWR